MVMAELHRYHDVDLRLGVGVDGLEGTDRVEGVRLSDGTAHPGHRRGRRHRRHAQHRVAHRLRAQHRRRRGRPTRPSSPLPGVVAAGDIARWPSARYGGLLRVEHWETAIQMGEAAAQRLLAEHHGTEPEVFDPVPWFWSDQYDRKIQLAGRSGGRRRRRGRHRLHRRAPLRRPLRPGRSGRRRARA